MTASLVDITNEIDQLKGKLADLENALLSLDKGGGSGLRTFDVTLRVTTRPENWGGGQVDCEYVKEAFESEVPSIIDLVNFNDPGDSIKVFNVTEIVEGGGEG